MSADRRALIVAAGLLVYLAVFVFSFVTAQVDPQPHDLPLAIAGPGAGKAAAAIEHAMPGGVGTQVVADDATARHAVTGRDAYGALVVGPTPPRLYVATANGMVATTAAEQALMPGAKAAGGGKPKLADLRRPDDGDPMTQVFQFLILPLIIVGILSANILHQRTPELSRTARLSLVASISAAGGLLTALLAGPVAGALPGAYLAESGILALGIFAIAAIATVLVDVIGDAGVGIGFLLFLIIGNIGSGAASAPEFLPAFWRVLGPFFPPGATATALRDVAYFDGAKLLEPMLVLVGWGVLGIAASLLAVRIPERGEGKVAAR